MFIESLNEANTLPRPRGCFPSTETGFDTCGTWMGTEIEQFNTTGLEESWPKLSAFVMVEFDEGRRNGTSRRG